MKFQDNFINFSVNFAPYENKKITANLKEKLPKLLKEYPEPSNKGTIKYLANNLHIPPENIIIGQGSTEIIDQICSVTKRYKQAIIPDPTFWEYKFFSEKAGKKISLFYLDENEEFQINLSKLSKELKRDTIVFLCNPNNPTSKLLKKNDLIKLIRQNPKTFFVIDETYLLFLKDYKNQTLIKEASKLNNLFVVFSLSKLFSLGGLRIGIGISNQKIISGISERQTLFKTPLINQEIIPLLFEDKSWIKKIRDYIKKERQNMIKKLNKIKGLKVHHSNSNFILIKCLKDKDLEKELNKKFIRIRGGEEFRRLGNKWIRISVKDKKSNKILIQAIKQILK